MDAARLAAAGEEDDDEHGLQGTARGGKSQSPGPGAYNVRRFAEYPPPSLASAAENAAALAAGAVLMTEVRRFVKSRMSLAFHFLTTRCNKFL